MNERSGSQLDFVHQFRPAAQEGHSPALLLLHGTGGDENDLLDLGAMILPGAPLLSPRGKVLENGMPRFFRRLAEGVFDETDLRRRSDELAGFVCNAAVHYEIANRPIIAVGFSNGANIAASLLLLHPDALAGAVLFHPMVPLVPDQLPDLKGTPVFIGAGQMDPIVPTENTRRLVKLLQDCGASVTMYWQPGGHGISAAEVSAAREWAANSAPILAR